MMEANDYGVHFVTSKEIDPELSEAIITAPEFPEGYNKQNPPPSGFVDEPEVYEEVNLGETTAQREFREAQAKRFRERLEADGLDPEERLRLLNEETTEEKLARERAGGVKG